MFRKHSLLLISLARNPHCCTSERSQFFMTYFFRLPKSYLSRDCCLDHVPRAITIFLQILFSNLLHYYVSINNCACFITPYYNSDTEFRNKVNTGIKAGPKKASCQGKRSCLKVVMTSSLVPLRRQGGYKFC